MFLFFFGCKIPAQSNPDTLGIRMIARHGRDASLSAVPRAEESAHRGAVHGKTLTGEPVRVLCFAGPGMSLPSPPARDRYSVEALLTKVAANIGLPSNSEVTLLPSLSKKACSDMELSSL
ncbi:MAG: hypothetical protein VX081_00050 [Pseudomonadota bacterium]|nr:hypothetical protein [Pseudomonadota bacterium]